jgi:hypothetical protein
VREGLFLRKKPRVLYFQQGFDGFFHGSLVVRRTMIYSYLSASIGSIFVARRPGR